MKLSSLAAVLFGGGMLPAEARLHRGGGAPPVSRSGHTGIPAARRAKHKQKNIAAKR